jgi:hypothetical protein
VRRLHLQPEFNGALFQVAQFNLLEMASSNVPPEHGVHRQLSLPKISSGVAQMERWATLCRDA